MFAARKHTYMCLHAEFVLMKKVQVQSLTVPGFCCLGGVRVTWYNELRGEVKESTVYHCGKGGNMVG